MLLFTKRHWAYLYPRLAFWLLLALIPIGVFLWIIAITAGLGGTAGKVAAVISVLWFLYWVVRSYFAWYRYQHDIWVVTDQRIVDSTKNNWFHHRMASADLTDVEDIAVDRAGVLSTMFNFGDVRCQTAGEVPNFVLAGIPEPTKVLGLVDSARDAARRELGRPALQ